MSDTTETPFETREPTDVDPKKIGGLMPETTNPPDGDTPIKEKSIR